MVKGYSVRRLDEGVIKGAMSRKLVGAPPPDSPTERTTKFQEITEEVCAKRLPKIRASLKRGPWWSRDLQSLKLGVTSARIRKQRCTLEDQRSERRTEFGRKTTAFQRAMRVAKEASWEAFVRHRQ